MRMFALSLVPASIKRSTRSMSIIIKLKNNSDKNYLISDDSIMSDGFLSNKFKIVDTHGNVVPYHEKNAKYKPQYTFLEKGQELQNELDLAIAYSVIPGEHYTISYNTVLVYCEHDEEDTCCVAKEIIRLSTEPINIWTFDKQLSQIFLD